MNHTASPFLDKVDRWRAGVVDAVSFGFVNTVARRHRLPKDLLQRWHQYASHWAARSSSEYYAIPDDHELPPMPHSGPWRFVSPIRSDYSDNNTTAFDLFPCKKGWSAPTMILAHGLMSVSDMGYRLWAKRLNERGWNAVFMHLPYHYSRRLRRHLTGEFAVSAHPLRTAEGIRQAVVEARVLLRTLKNMGGQLFGGWGTSYGGWIMAQTACVDPLLQRLILVEPILNIETAIWESPASITVRQHMRQAGIKREDLRPHLRLCCPSHQKPLTEGRNVLLLAGEYDRIAPPELIRQLNQKWEGSHYHCFKQGHVGYTLMPESFRLAQDLWADDFRES
ncbi:MAG: hypothetical protein B9S32_00040 [Verrucomicrobia bacterium Tous-C9LFEB]|nr:MAG: hypothetical protein B9S32_00040 [Verrucomicrobia bacterium Tous-C9LFEB]